MVEEMVETIHEGEEEVGDTTCPMTMHNMKMRTKSPLQFTLT
jgi:hypothetical protein